MAVTFTQLNQLYLAYFGRPVDYNGFIFYTNNPASTVDTVAAAFASSPESQALFGGNTTAQVTAIYRNLFNRDPEVAGLTYWTGQIAKGAFSAPQAALVILQAAAGSDATSVTNKLAASLAFFNSMDTVAEINGYAGTAAAASARSFLATVSDAATSVPTQTQVDAALATAIGTGSSNPGQAFNLTTNQDNFTGTTGNDTFTAGVSTAADGVTLVNTLQGIDQLNGGAGTDTLNVTLNGGAVTPSLTGIENVVLRATGAANLDLSASTGVTSVTVSNSTAVGTVSNIGNASFAVTNQNQNANLNGSTATALGLTFDTVGKSTASITVDLGSATANAATSFAITANNAFVTMTETTASAATTSATIAATGKNKITFAGADAASLTSVTTSGAGSVDLSGVALSALKTLTAGDGGVKATITNGTAGAVTVTTGAGADTISVAGAGVKAISTGAGNDKVTTTASALSATSTVDLGAGDDSITVAATFPFAAGATLNGGDGTDTLGLAKADYTTVSGYSAANLALITNFEVLSITDALATGDNIDVSKIAGIGSFTAAAGVTAANAATVSNLGAASTVTLAGANANSGTLTALLKTDTSADTMTLVLNKDFTDNNDTASTATAASMAVSAPDIETLTIKSTGNNTSLPFTAVDGYKADTITNTLLLNGSNKLASITVTGDQALVFASTAAMTKLATVDASANTGGLTFDGSLADMTTPTTSPAMTIKGSATAANALIGTGHADTIVGGAKADTITGGLGGDTLTGNGGNDVFVYTNANQSTLVNLDNITDFVANTVGQGASGAADANGAVAAAASRNGDVININGETATHSIALSIQTNAADAQTAIQNLAADVSATTVNAALDSTSGNLYIDLDNNGTVDQVIHLAGVTTLTTAAFIV